MRNGLKRDLTYVTVITRFLSLLRLKTNIATAPIDPIVNGFDATTDTDMLPLPVALIDFSPRARMHPKSFLS